MARAIWSGSIGFGLVNVPVGLFSATEDKTVHFNQFEKGTDDRVRNKRVNEDTGKEVKYSDIVKGYDLGDGRHVLVTPDELEEVEPGKSSTIEITDFVDAADIDPVYYRKSYYLAPSSDDAARPYGLLLQAMEKAGRIGIATLVMRNKQYLAAIRPNGRVLVLETMYFGDEVRDPADELPSIPRKASFSDKDLKTAVGLIDSLTAEWKPEAYEDTYRDRVLQLVQGQGQGPRGRDRQGRRARGRGPRPDGGPAQVRRRREIASESRETKSSAEKLRTRRADDEDKSAKKAGTRKPPTKKTTARKSAAKTPKKSVPRKTAAKKTAAKKSVVEADGGTQGLMIAEVPARAGLFHDCH